MADKLKGNVKPVSSGEDSEEDSETEMETKKTPSSSSPSKATPTATTTTTTTTNNNNNNPATTLSGALLSVVKPSIHQLSSRLLELQESQEMLVHTIQMQRGELALETSPEWRAAKAILDRIPEYQAKVKRVRATMNATHQVLARVDKGAATLRGKLEDKERDRAAKKTQDAAEFSKVVQR